jgi:adenylate cyclase
MPESPPPSNTFMFADIAGFTALTEAHGDEQAADLACEFAESVEAELPAYGGELLKTIGDALMLRVEEPAAAVQLGLLIVSDLMRQHQSPEVRVGMHHGPAVHRDGDWWGATVNIAARISGEASGGEVLLSDVTRQRAGEIEGVSFHSVARLALRNVSEPVLVYRAVAAGARQDGLPIDPVCRMAVAHGREAGRLSYADVEYTFCSLDCAAAFARNPERCVAGAP